MSYISSFLDWITPRFLTEFTLATIDSDKKAHVICPLKYASQEDLDGATHFIEVRGFNLFGTMIGCKAITLISKTEYFDLLQLEDEQ